MAGSRRSATRHLKQHPCCGSRFSPNFRNMRRRHCTQRPPCCCSSLNASTVRGRRFKAPSYPCTTRGRTRSSEDIQLALLVAEIGGGGAGGASVGGCNETLIIMRPRLLKRLRLLVMPPLSFYFIFLSHMQPIRQALQFHRRVCPGRVTVVLCAGRVTVVLCARRVTVVLCARRVTVVLCPGRVTVVPCAGRLQHMARAGQRRRCDGS